MFSGSTTGGNRLIGDHGRGSAQVESGIGFTAQKDGVAGGKGRVAVFKGNNRGKQGRDAEEIEGAGNGKETGLHGAANKNGTHESEEDGSHHGSAAAIGSKGGGCNKDDQRSKHGQRGHNDILIVRG